MPLHSGNHSFVLCIYECIFILDKTFLLIKGEFLASLPRKTSGGQGYYRVWNYHLLPSMLATVCRENRLQSQVFPSWDTLSKLLSLSMLYFSCLKRNKDEGFTGGPVVKNHLPVQGIWAPPLAWGASTCHRASGPPCSNFWSCGPQSQCSAARGYCNKKHHS